MKHIIHTKSTVVCIIRACISVMCTYIMMHKHGSLGVQPSVTWFATHHLSLASLLIVIGAVYASRCIKLLLRYFST